MPEVAQENNNSLVTPKVSGGSTVNQEELAELQKRSLTKSQATKLKDAQGMTTPEFQRQAMKDTNAKNHLSNYSKDAVEAQKGGSNAMFDQNTEFKVLHQGAKKKEELQKQKEAEEQRRGYRSSGALSEEEMKQVNIREQERNLKEEAEKRLHAFRGSLSEDAKKLLKKKEEERRKKEEAEQTLQDVGTVEKKHVDLSNFLANGSMKSLKLKVGELEAKLDQLGQGDDQSEVTKSSRRTLFSEDDPDEDISVLHGELKEVDKEMEVETERVKQEFEAQEKNRRQEQEREEESKKRVEEQARAVADDRSVDTADMRSVDTYLRSMDTDDSELGSMGTDDSDDELITYQESELELIRLERRKRKAEENGCTDETEDLDKMIRSKRALLDTRKSAMDLLRRSLLEPPSSPRNLSRTAADIRSSSGPPSVSVVTREEENGDQLFEGGEEDLKEEPKETSDSSVPLMVTTSSHHKSVKIYGDVNPAHDSDSEATAQTQPETPLNSPTMVASADTPGSVTQPNTPCATDLGDTKTPGRVPVQGTMSKEPKMESAVVPKIIDEENEKRAPEAPEPVYTMPTTNQAEVVRRDVVDVEQPIDHPSQEPTMDNVDPMVSKISDEPSADEERQKCRKLIIIVAILLIVVVGASIGAVVASGGNGTQPSTPIKPSDSSTPTVVSTPAPSVPPTSAPVAPPSPPVSARYTSFEETLGAFFDDPEFPATDFQQQSLFWLADTDPAQLPEDTDPYKLLERFVMSVFYSVSRGQEWLSTNTWLTEKDVCEWETTSCQNSNVIDLSMFFKRLSGNIPSEMGLLTQLTKIEWGFNSLTGTIPTDFGRLTKLEGLIIDDNDLIGTIPSEIGLLTNLLRLEFDNNALIGTIPSEMGMLTKLTYLSLGQNPLTGTIPEEFSNLSGTAIFMPGTKLQGCTNNPDYYC